MPGPPRGAVAEQDGAVRRAVHPVSHDLRGACRAARPPEASASPTLSGAGRRAASPTSRTRLTSVAAAGGDVVEEPHSATIASPIAPARPATSGRRTRRRRSGRAAVRSALTVHSTALLGGRRVSRPASDGRRRRRTRPTRWRGSGGGEHDGSEHIGVGQDRPHPAPKMSGASALGGVRIGERRRTAARTGAPGATGGLPRPSGAAPSGVRPARARMLESFVSEAPPDEPHRRPARRPQPAPARRPSSTARGRCWSSPAPARARRACSPTASPTSRRPGSARAGRDPRDHVHEQGRAGDARARRAAARPLARARCGS